MDLNRRGFALGLLGAPFVFKSLPALAAPETSSADVLALGKHAVHPFLGVQPVQDQAYGGTGVGLVYMISVIHSPEAAISPFGNQLLPAGRIGLQICSSVAQKKHPSIKEAENAFLDSLDLHTIEVPDLRYRAHLTPGIANACNVVRGSNWIGAHSRRGGGNVALIRMQDVPLIGYALNMTNREVPETLIRTRWTKVGTFDEKRLAVWATNDPPPQLQPGTALVGYRSSNIDAGGILAAFQSGGFGIATERPKKAFTSDNYFTRVNLLELSA